MKSKRKKILIIRFSSIGDIVLTTPVVRALKQQMDAEIHFLTKKSYQSILAANPNIDKIITLKEKIKDNLPALKEENYDLIVDLHKNLRSKIVKSSLRKKVISFDKINFKKWLMVNLKWNLLPKKHIVDRYFDGLKSLGIQNDRKGLDFYLTKDDEIDIEKKYGVLKGEYIAFAIGGAHATKKMPVEKIISIVKSIDEPLILLGGKEDAAAGEKIVRTTGKNVFNTCGDYSISQSAFIVRQAGLVITHDTGMMHIAAAFDKKIISVWGNTIPEFGMYPYFSKDNGASEIAEVKGLSCRPCSKIGFDSCPKGHFKCMEEIDTTEILRYVHNRTI